MVLFIVNLALCKSLIDSARLGIFAASIVSAVAGLTLLMCLPTRG
jgi:Na+:H+ antiporter, NhaA family